MSERKEQDIRTVTECRYIAGMLKEQIESKRLDSEDLVCDLKGIACDLDIANRIVRDNGGSSIIELVGDLEDDEYCVTIDGDNTVGEVNEIWEVPNKIREAIGHCLIELYNET